MKKLLIGGAIAFAIWKFWPKSDSASTDDQSGADAGTPAEQYDLSVINAPNGNSFTVFNGQKWYTGSVEALNTWFKVYPQTQSFDLTQDVIDAIPTGGHMFEDGKGNLTWTA